MGRAERPRPKRLGEKLLQVRKHLGLSQTKMVHALGFTSVMPASISMYESGQREPPYPVLLKYARLGGCTMEELVDDEMEVKFRRRKKG